MPFWIIQIRYQVMRTLERNLLLMIEPTCNLKKIQKNLLYFNKLKTINVFSLRVDTTFIADHKKSFESEKTS